MPGDVLSVTMHHTHPGRRGMARTYAGVGQLHEACPRPHAQFFDVDADGKVVSMNSQIVPVQAHDGGDRCRPSRDRPRADDARGDVRYPLLCNRSHYLDPLSNYKGIWNSHIEPLPLCISDIWHSILREAASLPPPRDDT